MNVESLGLSQRVYELSDWKDTHESKVFNEKEGDWVIYYTDQLKPTVERVPLYTLGYLLRKLPSGYVVYRASSGMYRSGKLAMNDNEELVIEPFSWEQYVEPENAVAKLCIVLFKQGILKREEDKV